MTIQGAQPEPHPDADRWFRAVVALSLALLFFSVPHTLEDFAAGEPLKKGIPAPLLSGLVATLLAAQSFGLFALGRRRPLGLWVHMALGVIWPLAAGVAQLPVILGPEPYRSGAVSVAYVVGLLVLGPTMLGAAALGLRAGRGSGPGPSTKRSTS